MSVLKPNEQVHHLASTTFTLDKRYTNLKPIGKGSYGVVCKALNTYTNSSVAIKKITPMTRSIDDAKHVLREIRLMRHLGKHEHIVSLVNLIIRDTDDELYIIMELLDSDLHRVLQSSQDLSENHYRYFMFQLLCGIKYMHMNRIIHRDLKPGNLLISKDCRLRITDFGLARERPTGTNRSDIEQGINAPMTEHVVTRWYRAPELMLSPDGFYDYSVDIWSAGCILGEMLARKPLFPGKNFVHQLSLIFDVIGMPARADIAHIKNTQAKKFLASQKDKMKVAFNLIYPTASSASHSLLESILRFIPDRRLAIDGCLAHPFITEMNYPAPDYPPISSDFEFSYERKLGLTTSQLIRLINTEAQKIQRDAMQNDKALVAKLPLSEQQRIMAEWAQYEDLDQDQDSGGDGEFVESDKQEDSWKRRGSTVGIKSGAQQRTEQQQRKAKESAAAAASGRSSLSSRYVSLKPPVPKLSSTVNAAVVQGAPAVVSARDSINPGLGGSGVGTGAKRASSAPRERVAPAPVPAPAPAPYPVSAVSRDKEGMRINKSNNSNNPFGTVNKTSAVPVVPTVPLVAAVEDDVYVAREQQELPLPPRANAVVNDNADMEGEGLFSPKHIRNGNPNREPESKYNTDITAANNVTSNSMAEAVRSLEGSEIVQRAINVLSPARAAGKNGNYISKDREKVPPGSLWARKTQSQDAPQQPYPTSASNTTSVSDPSLHEANIGRAAEVEAGVKRLTDKYEAKVAARVQQQAEQQKFERQQRAQAQQGSVVTADDIDDYIASVLQSNNKMMSEYAEEGANKVAGSSSAVSRNRPVSAYMYNNSSSGRKPAVDLNSSAANARIGMPDDSDSDSNAVQEVGSDEDEEPVMPHSQPVAAAVTAVVGVVATADHRPANTYTVANYYDTGVGVRGSGSGGTGASRPLSAAISRQQQSQQQSRPTTAAAIATATRAGSYLDHSDTEEEDTLVMPAKVTPAYTTANTRPISSSGAGYRSNSAPRPRPQPQSQGQVQPHVNQFRQGQGQAGYQQPTYRHLGREQELQRLADEKARKQTGATGSGTAGTGIRKKRLTVPKSPKFSKMSRERAMGPSGSQRTMPPPMPVSLTQMQVPDREQQRKTNSSGDTRGNNNSGSLAGGHSGGGGGGGGGLYDDPDTVSDDGQHQLQQPYRSLAAGERPHPRPVNKNVSSMTAKAVADYLLSRKNQPPVPVPAPAVPTSSYGATVTSYGNENLYGTSSYHSRPKSGNKFGGTR